MVDANSRIRSAIKSAGVKYWQVASILGMHDSNFSRLLRVELDREGEDRVLNAIRKAKEVYANGSPKNARS